MLWRVHYLLWCVHYALVCTLCSGVCTTCSGVYTTCSGVYTHALVCTLHALVCTLMLVCTLHALVCTLPASKFSRYLLYMFLHYLRYLFLHYLHYLSCFSIPDVPFSALLSALIRRRFQVKPATLLTPFIFFLFVWWRSVTGSQSGSFSLINVGSGFSLSS